MRLAPRALTLCRSLPADVSRSSTSAWSGIGLSRSAWVESKDDHDKRPVRTAWQRACTALCWLLAIAFLMGAVTTFWPGETFFGPPYSEKFVDWGYPSWFRFVVGAGELVGALLLVRSSRLITWA